MLSDLAVPRDQELAGLVLRDIAAGVAPPTMDLEAAGNSSIQGAIVAKSFSCNGTFDFHFDDATGGNAAKKFMILSWAEL